MPVCPHVCMFLGSVCLCACVSVCVHYVCVCVFSLCLRFRVSMCLRVFVPVRPCVHASAWILGLRGFGVVLTFVCLCVCAPMLPCACASMCLRGYWLGVSVCLCVRCLRVCCSAFLCLYAIVPEVLMCCNYVRLRGLRLCVSACLCLGFYVFVCARVCVSACPCVCVSVCLCAHVCGRVHQPNTQSSPFVGRLVTLLLNRLMVRTHVR